MSPIYWLQCEKSHWCNLDWVFWVGQGEGGGGRIAHMGDLMESAVAYNVLIAEGGVPRTYKVSKILRLISS